VGYILISPELDFVLYIPNLAIDKMGETVEVGESLRLRAEFYDWDGDLFDPDSVYVSIWNNSGSKVVDRANANRQALGSYYYDYNVPSDLNISYAEQWTYLFEGVVGESKILDRGYFTVLPQVLVPRYSSVLEVATLLHQDITDETTPSEQEVARWLVAKERYIDELLNTSFTKRTTTNEIHTLDVRTPQAIGWIPVFLNHRPVQRITKFEYRYWWWGDWTEDSEGNIWRLEDNVLKVRRIWWWGRRYDIRVSYEWGYSEVPADIRELCTKLVVVDILQSEAYQHLLPAGMNSVIEIAQRAENYRDDCRAIIQRRKEASLI